jgi:hypothetical protein
MKTCRICSTPYSSSRQDLSFHWYVPKIDDSLQIPKTWVKKLFQFSKRNLLKETNGYQCGRDGNCSL